MRVAASDEDVDVWHGHEVDEHFLETPEQLDLVEEYVALAGARSLQLGGCPCVELVWIAQRGA